MLNVEVKIMSEKKRVMLVDDSAFVRTVLRNTLTSDERIQVVASCANGQIALDQLDTTKPDLVILDLEMPVMDGLTFLKNLRMRSETKVMVLSTRTDKLDEAISCGANKAMPKPTAAMINFREESGSDFYSHIYELLEIPAP